MDSRCLSMHSINRYRGGCHMVVCMNYRNEVMRTVNLESFHDDAMLMGVLGLVGEAGEIADQLKKERFQGKPHDHDKLIKELGDVRWYMEILCAALNVTMLDVEQINVAKLRNRYPNGFTVDASNNRKEGDV